MQEDIQAIISKGTWAPSGENKQPWRFVVDGATVFIFNIPERDRSLYNLGQMGSLVAHGCLIENMSIVASSYGYIPSVRLFPDPAQENLVATMVFIKAERREDPLFSCIELRSTNRKAYGKEPLSKEQYESLLKSIEGVGGEVRLTLVEDQEKKQAIARAVSINEKILFENEYMHSFFFKHVTWNEKEDQSKKMGLYIKTLELKPPQRLAFSLFKRWNILKRLNKTGAISKTVTQENAKVYASCAAFGALAIPQKTPSDFVNAGRAMERIWLTATKMGLSLQLTTGVLFLMHGCELPGMGQQVSLAHAELIRKTYRNLRDIFSIKGHVILIFRVGVAGPPSARSVRLSPDIVNHC